DVAFPHHAIRVTILSLLAYHFFMYALCLLYVSWSQRQRTQMRAPPGSPTSVEYARQRSGNSKRKRFGTLPSSRLRSLRGAYFAHLARLASPSSCWKSTLDGETATSGPSCAIRTSR